MNKNKYRCIGCDEVKNNKNTIWRPWTQCKKPSQTEIVAICRKCNLRMKRFFGGKIYGVKEFSKWIGF